MSDVLTLTATDRLARELRADHSLAQHRAGRTVWEAPPIFSLRQWLHEVWAASWPTAQLLHPVQELVLWRDAVAADRNAANLLSPMAAAREARRADQLAARFGIAVDEAPAYTEEQRAFRRWRRAVRAEYARHDWLTAADLAAAVTKLVQSGVLSPPTDIRLQGFFEPLPASERRLMETLVERGTRFAAASACPAAVPKLLSFPDAESQYRHIAAEIRDILRAFRDRDEAPPRILVLCADPEGQRELIETVFRPVLAPWLTLPVAAPRPVPWRWETGLRLDAYPLVDSALAILALKSTGNPPEGFSRMLLSSLLWTAAERAHTAALDYKLRKLARPALRLAQLAEHASDELRPRLQRLQQSVQQAPRRALPSDWAAVWSTRLSALGWPGSAPLSSAAFQTRREWERALTQFASLDGQLKRVSAAQAQSWLREMLGLRRFEPRVEHELPLHILRFDEAAGMVCDHLFIADATADRWPGPATPTPYLARDALAAAGVAAAAPTLQLEAARRLASHLLALAPAVTLCAPREDERAAELLPTPLFGAAEHWQKADARTGISDAESCAAAGPQVSLPPSDAVPAVADPVAEGLRGGVAIFRDFAEAPFFAFCRHRLGIERFPERERGLSAKAQGKVLHDALQRAWAELQTRAQLLATEAASLNRLIAGSVAPALKREMPVTDFGAALIRLESARLEDLVRQWLAHERQRVDAFEVLLREHEVPARVAGLALKLRIDRVDRVVTPFGVRHLVLDYKTGAEASPRGWKAEEMQEPQLPLYAASGVLEAAGIAQVDGICFAQVRDGHPAFAAETNWRKLLIRDEAAFEDAGWPAKLAAWRAALEDMARRFLAGEAGLDSTRSYARSGHADLLVLADKLESEA